jgi:metal-responsive CopG/Arc/MetJ family transcriptional regulator
MPKTKIAIAIDPALLGRLDDLVAEARFPSRSQAVEAAVRDALARFDRTRLARECAKLDPSFEQTLAEDGLAADAAAWPAY